MLARLGRAAESRLGVGLLEVVNGHVAVVVAHHHQVGVVHVHVKTHDATVAAEHVLRKAGVLHAVEQQHTPALLHEVICPEEDGSLRCEGPAALLVSPHTPSPLDGQALPCSASARECGVPLWASSSPSVEWDHETWPIPSQGLWEDPTITKGDQAYQRD